MAVIFTDYEINELLVERKSLLKNYRQVIQVRPKRGHSERELDIKGEKGHEFSLIFRQSHFNPLDFSVILAIRQQNSNQFFRLRRYNGKHGEHTNSLEGRTFYGFHIHTATERYQDIGEREDTFAEPTDRYADFNGAIRCMLIDCGFDVPEDPQLTLF